MGKYLLAGLALLIGNLAIAEENRQSELDDTRARIQSVQQNLQQLSGQKTEINVQLSAIEKAYGEAAALFKSLQQHVEQNQANLAQIQQEIRRHREAMATQRQGLAGQIKAAYAMGRQDKLKVLLNQQNPALAKRILVYYDYLNAAKVKKVAGIKETLIQLEALAARQQEESAQLERNLEHKRIEQTALDQVRNQRNQLLTQLDNDFADNEQHLAELKDSEEKLHDLVASLQTLSGNAAEQEVQDDEVAPEFADSTPAAGSPTVAAIFKSGEFVKLKGELPWPVSGSLVNAYGSPRLQSQWDGVLIEAKEGAEIHAVSDGVVTFSDWLRGYGLITIIDHGGGYMTLYAFNQSLYKKSGDKVAAGEVIASVGQSGGRSRPGLYFGIRKQGRPVNPAEWCRKTLSANLG
ncbi:MAG: peptidase M23 [Methylobacter sp.]|nr:MAG: peptidase M23 [Methylobacter sp.]